MQLMYEHSTHRVVFVAGRAFGMQAARKIQSFSLLSAAVAHERVIDDALAAALSVRFSTSAISRHKIPTDIQLRGGYESRAK